MKPNSLQATDRDQKHKGQLPHTPIVSCSICSCAVFGGYYLIRCSLLSAGTLILNAARPNSYISVISNSFPVCVLLTKQ